MVSDSLCARSVFENLDYPKKKHQRAFNVAQPLFRTIFSVHAVLDTIFPVFDHLNYFIEFNYLGCVKRPGVMKRHTPSFTAGFLSRVRAVCTRYFEI